MSLARRRLGSLAVSALLAVSACTSASPSPTITAGPTASPVPSGSPTASPAPTATASTSPTSTTSEPPAFGTWTTPILVRASDQCVDVTATVDSGGHVYIADDCDDTIHVASGPTGGPLASQTLDHPAGSLDSGPQLAVDSGILYVAYTENTPLEGCGSGGGQATAVIVRSRQLAAGSSWTAPLRIGLPQDSLDTLRVSAGLMEATVIPGSGTVDRLVFETAGATTHRYAINGSGGSLRIGSDGKARIAYQASGAIGYAVFNGAGFALSRIPGPSGGRYSMPQLPHLVLDGADHAHVMWTITEGPGGCALPPGSPDDGTYYGSDASGSWKVARISVSTGPSSLTVDPGTGQIHALLADTTLMYLTLPPDEAWWASTVVAWGVASPTIREAADGTLIATFVAAPTGEQNGVYLTTLPTDAQLLP